MGQLQEFVAPVKQRHAIFIIYPLSITLVFLGLITKFFQETVGTQLQWFALTVTCFMCLFYKSLEKLPNIFGNDRKE